MNLTEAVSEAIEFLEEEARQAHSDGYPQSAAHLQDVANTLKAPPEHYRLSELVPVSSTDTDPRFWDCDCDDVYIHSKSVDTMCPLCKVDMYEEGGIGDLSADVPDSRVLEIAQGGKFATDDSWLHAYNLEEYYDSLDWYDTHRYNGAEIASIEAIIIFRKQERS